MRTDRQNCTAATSGPRVVVLAYDGLCTFEFGVAVELFGLPRPEMGAAWYRFEVTAIEPGPLRATGGVWLEVDGGLERLAGAHTIVVPGWRDPAERPPEELLDALRQAHAGGARLMSICSGVFVLAATGLLAGRRATTHWRYTERLARSFPDITVAPDVLYVDEGDILTSAGSAAGIDLGLHLIRRDFGRNAANAVARRLVVPPHREGGQAQILERPVPTAYEGPRLGPLFDRIRRRLGEPLSVPALAAEVGMSPRTFLRRFREATGCTPKEWLVRERLAHARALLESSGATVEEIAAICGLGSAKNLRLHFRTHFDCGPSDYRRRFEQDAGRIETGGAGLIQGRDPNPCLQDGGLALG